MNDLNNTQKKKFRATIPSSVGSYIDATVGGVPLYFTIDTGASQTIDGVSPSVFRCTSTPMETGPIRTCVET